MTKNVHTMVQLHLLHIDQGNGQNPPSQTSAVVNQELPDIQAGFRKAEKPEIKWPTFISHRKCEGIPEKISTSASLTMLKLLTVDHNKLWKIL